MTTKTFAFIPLFILLSCGESEPEGDTDTTPAADGGTSSGSDDTGWTETERMNACEDAGDAGYFTAWDIISDCECDEDEVYATWGLDAYTTDFEQECYIGAWGNAWLQWCTETCVDPVDGSIDKALEECCRAMLDWATAQFP